MRLNNSHKWGIVVSILVIAAGLMSVTRAQSVSSTNTSAIDTSDLEKQLQDKRKSIEDIQKKIEGYRKDIERYQGKALTLQNQLSVIRSRIESAKLKIDETQDTIDENTLERTVLDKKLAATHADLEHQKEMLAVLLRLYHREDDPSIVEVFVRESTIASYFDALEGNRQLESTMNQTITHIEELLATYQLEQSALAQKHIDLQRLHAELTDRRLALTSEEITQQNILTQTRQTEKGFQTFLSKARAEELVAEQDVNKLENTIRAKLKQKGLDSKLSPDGAVSFVWPVPNAGIAAYFHDPDYPYRNVFEHPAIDIRTVIGGKSSNGVPVRAAASGYVARARDGGSKGYSYIMIIHNNQYSTVYGHVSRIDVNEDDFVTQGQVIGLSGGAPGTHGAGNLTTGPHLHFEVRKEGIPVNPLDYLP